MAAKPIVLPSKTFDTTSEAKEFFSKMLKRYKEGERVLPEDEGLLYELFQRSPDIIQKSEFEFGYFLKKKSKDWPTSCFHVSWVGGHGDTDFGMKSCIEAKAPTTEQSFYSACRYSVDASLTAKKKAIFEKSGGHFPCIKTGVDTTFTTSNYRHTEPRFKDIVNGFIELNQLQVHESMLTSSENSQYVTRFLDPEMEQAFILYHESVARLEIFAK